MERILKMRIDYELKLFFYHQILELKLVYANWKFFEHFYIRFIDGELMIRF